MTPQQHELQLDLPMTTSGSTAGGPAPGAQYSLQLNDQPLAFRLRRSQRSNVAFAVDEAGLKVNAPRGLTLPQIEQAIRAGSRAIVGKLSGQAAASGKLALPKRWHDGVRFPFLGHEVVLKLDRAANEVALSDDTLRLPLPSEVAERQIKDRVQSWLQGEARRVLEVQLLVCTTRLGLVTPPWQLSFAAGSWGGMEADGRLRLSWRLIHLTPEEIERVLLRCLAPMQARQETGDLWC